PPLVADGRPRLEEDAFQVARKGHAVVERVLLVIDHHDLARCVVLAQLLRRVRAGRAVTDDDETSGVRAQAVLLRRWCGQSVAESARGGIRTLAVRVLNPSPLNRWATRASEVSCTSRS